MAADHQQIPMPITEKFRGSLQQFQAQTKGIAIQKNMPKWFPEYTKAIGDFCTELFGALCDLEKVNKELESGLAVQKSVTEALEKDRNKLKIDVGDLQQYSRRTNILIHGIKEEKEESTDDLVLNVVNDSLEIADITVKDISRSHRLGKKKDGKTRPIIARFTSYRSKQAIYKTKRKLKGKGIVITENLTKERYDLYQKCQTRFGKDKCWTIDGNIHLLTGKINGQGPRKGEPEVLVVTRESELPADQD